MYLRALAKETKAGVCLLSFFGFVCIVKLLSALMAELQWCFHVKRVQKWAGLNIMEILEVVSRYV